MLTACLSLRAEREICEASVFARGVEGHLRAWQAFDQHVSEITYAINTCKPFVEPETYADLDSFAAAIQAVPIEEEEEEEQQPPSSPVASRLMAIEARLDALEKTNVGIVWPRPASPPSKSVNSHGAGPSSS